MFQCERGCDFEKSRVWIPTANQIANGREAIGSRLFGNHFAVYANALTERDKVRGCEQAGRISLCATDRIDHGANGAFAVCAGDVNDFAVAKIDAQLSDESLDIFQAQFDPEALEAVEPCERVFICQGRPRHFRPWRRYIHGATAK